MNIKDKPGKIRIHLGDPAIFLMDMFFSTLSGPVLPGFVPLLRYWSRIRKWSGLQWRDYLLFYEHFHGDTGAGLGASHQTGWTGLVAKTLQLFGLLDPNRALDGGQVSATGAIKVRGYFW